MTNTEGCIFCNIAKGEVSVNFIYADEDLMAFNDINPKARVHVLIVPKRHIDSVINLTDGDKDLVGRIILKARDIAKEKKLIKGYKLMFNVGRAGGQLVNHVHLHLMGGENSLAS